MEVIPCSYSLEVPRLKISLPIRLKILLLITVSLAGSLLAYTYVGSQLIVADKTSYIYDYTLAEVTAAAERIESRLQQLTLSLTTLAQMTLSGNAPPVPSQQYFDRNSVLLGIQSVSFYAKPTQKDLAPYANFGKPASHLLSESLIQAVADQSFYVGNAQSINSDEILLPIVFESIDQSGQKIWITAEIRIPSAILGESSKNYELVLARADGGALLSKPLEEAPGSHRALSPGTPEATSFYVEISKKVFDNGVHDFKHQDVEWIGAFKRLKSRNLIILGMIERDRAFSAARQLIYKSVALGLSILFFAIGLTLVSVKTLTKQLQDMFRATQKVAGGDFTVRVDTSRSSDDEVGGLARSFNAMAEKIDDLMIQTAEKARMEKELETAQEVQARFFPLEALHLKQISVYGKYIPASECAGDWWHYAQVGDELLVVVGDVTGHGVSAALVTAAAHAIFLFITNEFKTRDQPKVDLVGLLLAMNSAVYAAGDGEATMSLVASLINLKTGHMTMINASHPPLYVLRSPVGGLEPIGVKSFKPLMGGRVPALGESLKYTVEMMEYSLEPGDRLFWYTDGAIETRPSDGVKLSKTQFLRMLGNHSGGSELKAEEIAPPIIEEILDFYGRGPTDRPDDITLVVATFRGV